VVQVALVLDHKVAAVLMVVKEDVHAKVPNLPKKVPNLQRLPKDAVPAKVHVNQNMLQRRLQRRLQEDVHVVVLAK
jgi:hypothetical protein